MNAEDAYQIAVQAGRNGEDYDMEVEKVYMKIREVAERGGTCWFFDADDCKWNEYRTAIDEQLRRDGFVIYHKAQGLKVVWNGDGK